MASDTDPQRHRTGAGLHLSPHTPATAIPPHHTTISPPTAISPPMRPNGRPLKCGVDSETETGGNAGEWALLSCTIANRVPFFFFQKTPSVLLSRFAY
jgi:hypothetical protein